MLRSARRHAGNVLALLPFRLLDFRAIPAKYQGDWAAVTLSLLESAGYCGRRCSAALLNLFSHGGHAMPQNELQHIPAGSANGGPLTRQSDPAPPRPDAPRPEPAAELTPEQQAALHKARQEAGIIDQLAFPAAMAGALQLERYAGPEGLKLYLEELTESCGAPTDPVEQMLIQQLALAHHRIAQLHVSAAEAGSVELVKAYSAAAVRLTGEFRRLALALRTYRQPVSTRHFTVVRQQNLATGNQQVAYIEQQDAQTRVPSTHTDSELSSNRPQEALEYAQTPEPLPRSDSQSEAGGRRSPQPIEAEGPDTRRP